MLPAVGRSHGQASEVGRGKGGGGVEGRGGAPLWQAQVSHLVGAIRQRGCAGERFRKRVSRRMEIARPLRRR